LPVLFCDELVHAHLLTAIVVRLVCAVEPTCLAFSDLCKLELLGVICWCFD
jgi:hypothetical protein